MIAWSAIEVDRVEGGRATVARHAEPRITRKTHPLSSDSLRKMAENAARNGALSVGAGEQVGSVAPQIGHAARDLLRLPAVPVRRDIGAVVVAERSHRMRPLSAARQATMAGTASRRRRVPRSSACASWGGVAVVGTGRRGRGWGAGEIGPARGERAGALAALRGRAPPPARPHC